MNRPLTSHHPPARSPEAQLRCQETQYSIREQDKRIAKFDSAKTVSAIARAGRAAGQLGQDEAKSLEVSAFEGQHMEGIHEEKGATFGTIGHQI
jgi:hypothetical protein